MKMTLDNRDIAPGIGSILIVAGFVCTLRRGLNVHVAGEQTNRNRDAI